VRPKLWHRLIVAKNGALPDRYQHVSPVAPRPRERSPLSCSLSRKAQMLPPPRIGDLGWTTSFKADCRACDHVALLTPEALLRLGQGPPSTEAPHLRCSISKGGSGAVAFEAFVETYQVNTRERSCLTQDRETLLAFCDFAAEQHLRTTNPIESTFTTVPANLTLSQQTSAFARHGIRRGRGGTAHRRFRRASSPGD
jgi:hypothetical protein